MSSVFSIKPSKYEIEHAGQIHAGIAYEAEHGTLPSTPFWSFLEHRHDLNPARFDFYHPVSGYLIEHQGPPPPPHVVECRPFHPVWGHMRTGCTCHSEPPVPPPVVPPGLPLIPLGPWETPHVVCQTVPPNTGHQTVPEPATITMFGVACLMYAAWRLFGKR